MELNNPINGSLVLMTRAQTFVKVVPVKAIQMAQRFFIISSGEMEYGEVGDYLCMGPNGSRWICPRKMFEQVYTPANLVKVEKQEDGVRVDTTKLPS